MPMQRILLWTEGGRVSQLHRQGQVRNKVVFAVLLCWNQWCRDPSPLPCPFPSSPRRNFSSDRLSRVSTSESPRLLQPSHQPWYTLWRKLLSLEWRRQLSSVYCRVTTDYYNWSWKVAIAYTKDDRYKQNEYHRLFGYAIRILQLAKVAVRIKWKRKDEDEFGRGGSYWLIGYYYDNKKNIFLILKGTTKIL